MSLSPTTVESLFHLGRFREIVSGIDERRPDVAFSIDQLLTIAEAMVRTGKLERAERIVSDVMQRPLQGPLRARCEVIRGLVARESGRYVEGLQRLQASARIAKECGDIRCAAYSLLMALRMISESQPIRAVDSILAEIRTLTTRAGDPHLTALLHESVAKHEAQVGNLDEARRHLRIANNLLDSYPNVWFEQLCALNAFCIEFLNSDLRKAEQHLKHASKLAESTGAHESIIANNLGHLQLQLGQFAKAEVTLTRLAARSVGEVRYAALEGLGQLFLAVGRLEDCEQILDSLNQFETTPGLTPSFLFRSSLITRLRLLLRQSKWPEAAQAAEVAIREANAISDGTFLAVALFLKALAHHNQGMQSSEALLTAVQVGASINREYQGMFMQVCSELTRGQSDLVASRMTDRAKRVWIERGSAAVVADLPTQTGVEVPGFHERKQARSETSAFCAVNSLAAAFDLTYNARLFGTELKQLIEQARCSPKVQVVQQRVVEKPESHAGVHSLFLGTHRGVDLSLVCEAPGDPINAILLSDILRLGRNALALEEAREEERSRAALWPADPVEDQGDAIFLAEEMQALLATTRRIATTNVPVLITGETGTGKEVLARTIHACSTRAGATFLPFNCASTPKDMLDSQLFGHRRGAFTGAAEHFQGVIRAAAGGTLFLDEIGDTGLDVQPKLLRFLEASEVHPIGETQPARVDVRVIVATNADLEGLVRDGRFREDLFYRLSIVRLHLPPLRERRVEIPTLANHYLRKHAQEYRKGDLRLSEDTMEYLMLYRWPGNVRQLANEMRRIAALAETSAVLMPEHLSPEITASRRTVPASERVLEPTEVVVRLDQPMAAAVRHVEQTMVQYALKKCDGRIEETAAMLGLSRKGLYLKRQRFGIDPPEASANVAVGA
jgi:DNA-binding NtrC family response regulator/tetratricopeptide (TPR) repeat protein